MKRCLPILTILFTTVFVFKSVAQDKNLLKFKKVEPETFDLSKLSIIDSSTNALVLEDVGNSGFVGNNDGWFTMIFSRRTRIKIIDKKAFDLATVKVGLHANNDEREKLENLTGTTYNLENGKIIATPLQRRDLFEDKKGKYYYEDKFTMPAVKEGSIIEYSYTVSSNFSMDLHPWTFQTPQYPCLWSEYSVKIPSLLIYVFIPQIYDSFYIKKSDVGNQSYRIKMRSETGGYTSIENSYLVNAYTNNFRWVMKDMPAFHGENYLFSPDNYINKIEFQLSKISNDGEQYRDVMNDWTKATDELLKRSDFGEPLDADNFWIDDVVKKVAGDNTDEINKAKKIYDYVRDNYTCVNHYYFHIESSLLDVYKKQKGNVGEINLLLIAMLRHAGLKADPVILSTRDFGFNYTRYPLMDRLNYLIIKARMNGTDYFLDATVPELGFGHLSPACFNGHARIINHESPKAIYFNADSIREQTTTNVLIINDDKGRIAGTLNTAYGYMGSFDMRESVRKHDVKTIFKNLQTSYGSDVTVENGGIDSLDQPEFPVNFHYDFDLNMDPGSDILYFNPMMSEMIKENPFKSLSRKYPVEMDKPVDELYILNMEIPKGYKIDEIPQSVKVAFNGNEGFFEYIVQKSDDGILLRSHIKLNRSAYSPEEYNTLREFYGYVVKKQAEQIVFKKKK